MVPPRVQISVCPASRAVSRAAGPVRARARQRCAAGRTTARTTEHRRELDPGGRLGERVVEPPVELVEPHGAVVARWSSSSTAAGGRPRPRRPRGAPEHGRDRGSKLDQSWAALERRRGPRVGGGGASRRLPGLGPAARRRRRSRTSRPPRPAPAASTSSASRTAVTASDDDGGARRGDPGSRAARAVRAARPTRVMTAAASTAPSSGCGGRPAERRRARPPGRRARRHAPRRTSEVDLVRRRRRLREHVGQPVPRARCSRDFTVPRGQPSTAAVSASSRSSR